MPATQAHVADGSERGPAGRRPGQRLGTGGVAFDVVRLGRRGRAQRLPAGLPGHRVRRGSLHPDPGQLPALAPPVHPRRGRGPAAVPLAVALARLRARPGADGRGLRAPRRRRGVGARARRRRGGGSGQRGGARPLGLPHTRRRPRGAPPLRRSRLRRDLHQHLGDPPRRQPGPDEPRRPAGLDRGRADGGCASRARRSPRRGAPARVRWPSPSTTTSQTPRSRRGSSR